MLWTASETAKASQARRDSLADIAGSITYNHTYSGGTFVSFNPNILLVTFDKGYADSTYTISSQHPEEYSTRLFFFKDIKPQKIYIRISAVGTRTIEGWYEIEAGQNVLMFTMEETKERLRESKVTAEVPLSRQIKDTAIYNAAAVKVSDDENLRAMLEQLPGFNITDDKITVGGEEIKRTYVNGVLVFGDNPLTAVNTLKMEDVTQVRVYDEQNATDVRRGLKHSRKDRVLDVSTKTRILRLAETGALAEGGADESGQIRYNGTAAAAYHSEIMQLYGFVSAKNTGNISDRSAFRSGFSSVSEVLWSPLASSLDTYWENIEGGIGINKYWKDRLYGNNVSATYQYAKEYEKDAQTVLTEYFANGGNPAMTTGDTTSFRNTIGKHSVKAAFTLNDTPLKSIIINLEGNISDDRRTTLTASSTATAGTAYIYSRHETARNADRDYGIKADLSWTNNDARKIRPEINAGVDFSRRTSLSWTVDTLSTSFDRRNLTSDGFGRNFRAYASAGISKTLVNTDNRTLSIDADINSDYSMTKSKALTTDEADGYEIDLANTYDNTWNGLTSSLHASLAYITKHFTARGGIYLQNTLQLDDERYPAPPYTADPNTWTGYGNRRSYWSLRPHLSISYKTLKISASASPSIPSSEQTRNRISDTNPLVLTGGNPDLHPSYNTRLAILLSQPVADRYGNINISLSGECRFNPIVTKTQYFTENTVLSEWDGYTALAGSMLHTFENAGTPAWKADANISATGMMLKRTLSASIGLMASYSALPQYYGGQLIGINDFNTGGSISLNYRPDKNLRFSISGSSFYVNSLNDGKTSLSERTVTSARASSSVRFAKYGEISAQYHITSYNYLGGAGTDFMSHSLNAEISWSFLKRTLTVAFRGLDLLDTGSIYTSSVTADASTQTWNPVYGRYFLISIRYMLQKKG